MQKVTFEAFDIIGIKVRTSNEQGRAEIEIPALWQKFMRETISLKIPNKISDEVYAVYTNYEGDHLLPYDLILGCPVSSLENIPDGMVSHKVPQASYRKYISKGDLTKDAIINTWMQIWKDDINRSFTSDFELYSQKATNPTDGEASIYIAVNA